MSRFRFIEVFSIYFTITEAKPQFPLRAIQLAFQLKLVEYWKTMAFAAGLFLFLIAVRQDSISTANQDKLRKQFYTRVQLIISRLSVALLQWLVPPEHR